MESIGDVAVCVVATALGDVEVSAATHAGGTVSVVAWLRPDGRRVGYLSHSGRGSARSGCQIDPRFAATAVPAVMQATLAAARGDFPRPVPIGERLVRAGLLTDAQRQDLLGWQWLLDEVGEHHRMGELALAAGLLSEAAMIARGCVLDGVLGADDPPASPATRSMPGHAARIAERGRLRWGRERT